jgi:molybdopterin-guanine dinucleotide biosynthesis protein B
MNDARMLGIAGWSGSGKTTLITKLIPFLATRGMRVATLKHAHHAFDVDTPGKDSYEHRKAGACEVIVSSARRWVQMHEVGAGPEATLAQLLARLSPCDLVLVEGFKTPLHPEDQRIVAIASDASFPDAGIPTVDINDIAAIAELIIARAEPLEKVIAALET